MKMCSQAVMCGKSEAESNAKARVRTSPAEQPLPELPKCGSRFGDDHDWGGAPKSPGPSTAAPAGNIQLDTLRIYLHLHIHVIVI